MAEYSNNHEPQHGNYFVRIQSNGWQVNSKTFSWNPPTDVFENDKNFIIKIEISGMKQSDIFINIEDNTLVVSGTRNESIDRRAYRQMEIQFGEFNTVVDLPKGLSLENFEADYDDGFLTITIPYIKTTTVQIKG